MAEAARGAKSLVHTYIRVWGKRRRIEDEADICLFDYHILFTVCLGSFVIPRRCVDTAMLLMLRTNEYCTGQQLHRLGRLRLDRGRLVRLCDEQRRVLL